MPEDRSDLVLSFTEYERVFELPVFKDEWIEKFTKTGVLKRLTLSLKKKVEYINTYIDGDFLIDNVIEKPIEMKGLFSIRVEPRSINARVISTLCNIDGEKCMILLYAFQEKNITNTKMKSYTKAESIARGRCEKLHKRLCE